MTSGGRRGTPWAGHQSLTELTQGRKKTLTLRFTPMRISSVTDIHYYKYEHKLHYWLKVSSKSHAGSTGFGPVYQSHQARFNFLSSLLVIQSKRSVGKNLNLFLIHFHTCQSRLPLNPLFWLEYLSNQKPLHLLCVILEIRPDVSPTGHHSVLSYNPVRI